MKYTLKVRALSSSYFAGHDTDEYVRGAIRDLFDEDRKGLKNAIADCDITQEDVSDMKRKSVVSLFDALVADNIFENCSYQGADAFKFSGWEPFANGEDMELIFSVEIDIDIKALYDVIDGIMKDIKRQDEDAVIDKVLQEEEMSAIGKKHRQKPSSEFENGSIYYLLENPGA